MRKGFLRNCPCADCQAEVIRLANLHNLTPAQAIELAEKKSRLDARMAAR